MAARRFRLPALGAGLTLMVGAVTASVPAAAQQNPSSASTGNVRYAQFEQICPQSPQPGVATCFGMRRVPASASTPNAVAYTVPSVATGPSGGYTPGDLATAYGITNPDAATSITVGIVDAYDDANALSELNTFDAHYGLPAETATSFRKVNQTGATSPLPAGNANWAGEIALDLQAVRGLCHKCKILLVEGNTSDDTNLATAVDTAVAKGAKIVSNSYGSPEYGSATFASHYNHPGVVILASTGDHGWYDWDFANDVPNGSYDSTAGASDNAPNTPAAYPTVVAVGGTELHLNSDGTRQGEYVWNGNGPDDDNGLAAGYWWGDSGASGGGCSLQYAAPTYQHAVAGYAATGCGTKRATGDVAALADPATGYDVYTHSGGWGTVGGTSLATPLVAAMWALAGGGGGLRYPGQNLYDNFRFHPGSRYDVTIGGNSFCAGDTMAGCSAYVNDNITGGDGSPNDISNGSTQLDSTNPPQGNGWTGLLDCSYPYDGSAATTTQYSAGCNATPGYDGPSGVGTPRGLQLFRSTQPKVVVQHPTVMKLNAAETFTATITDPVANYSIVSRTWTFGDGTAATTSATHTYTKAGTFTVTLKIKDNYGRTASGTTTITVGKALYVKFTGSTTVHHKVTYAYSSSGSLDYNTGGKISSVSWNFGDGHTATGASVTHAWATNGTYTLTETLADNAGVRTSRRVTITVVT
jgi:PKD repeat protein